jgi:hypothetical protein
MTGPIEKARESLRPRPEPGFEEYVYITQFNC